MITNDTPGVFDRLGKRLQPGDIIAYAVRSGNSGAMKFRVVESTVGDYYWSRDKYRSHGAVVRVILPGFNADDEFYYRRSKLQHPERMAVVTLPDMRYYDVNNKELAALRVAQERIRNGTL